jgi:hypothetical protein
MVEKSQKEEDESERFLILMCSLGTNLPVQHSKGTGIHPDSMTGNLEKTTIARWNQNGQRHQSENEIELTISETKRSRSEHWQKIGTHTNN